MSTTMKALKKSIITKVCDVSVLCHECFRDVLTLNEVKDMSFLPIKKWHNWVSERYDRAWFMVTFTAKVDSESLRYGVYLDFDGEGIVYAENGETLGAINNNYTRDDRLGITRSKWVFLHVKDGEKVTLYVEVAHNAPKRPRSFPAFFKDAYFGSFDIERYREYYYLLSLDDTERESLLKGGDFALPREMTRHSDIMLTNTLEYGHLKPIVGYSRECQHEYIKVVRALDAYANVTYLAGSAYDIFSVRDKALRHAISAHIKGGRIRVPANLTDFDLSVVSGETIVRGIALGYHMLRDIYGVESRMVSFRSHTLPTILESILDNAHIDTLYVDRLESGMLGDISVISKDTDTLPLNEYNLERVHRDMVHRESASALYHGEIIKEDTEGAYTTMARLKLYNRQVETALHNIEFLATYSYLLGNKYPTEAIDNAYRTMLKYASYNALAGNNTKVVNDALREGYIALGKELASIRDSVLKSLGGANTRCVINTSPYRRSEWFKVGSDWYRTEAEPYSIAKIVRGAQPDRTKVAYSDNSIENDILRVTFNKAGEIVSLIDKRNGSESIGGKSMRFCMFNDDKRHDNAINIRDGYYGGVNASFKFMRHKVFIDGATIIWQNQYKFRRNSILENIVLTEGDDYLRVDTRVVWQDVNTMLRVEIVPNATIDTFRSDSAFTSVERTAHTEKRSHGEFPINKWIMTGENGGLGITTDSKYGVRVTPNMVSINLLRSTRYPDNSADIGTHYFTITLMPNATTNSINRLAYDIVLPILVEDKMIDMPSLVASDNDSIVVETIRKGKADGSILVRLYDISGEGGSTTLNTAFGYSRAVSTDILEESRVDVDVENIHLAPLEIKTILFEDVHLK